MSEYYIPTGPGEAEFTEKRSRFLGHVRMVESEDEARAFIADMKKKYYDARHNCWCYSIKDGPERYSDDGEPQGSAGIPMLEVLRRQGVTNAVCVGRAAFCAPIPRVPPTPLRPPASPPCAAGWRRSCPAPMPSLSA